MAAYRFLTTFCLPAPRDAVFDAITHVERWAPRWSEIVRVAVDDDGEPDGRGRTVAVTLRASLGYRLAIRLATDRIEPNHRFDVVATGDVVGRGSWRLVEEAGLTHGSYLWEVRTTKAWMNLLAPVARPIFARDHDRAMRNGIAALATHLGVEPVSIATGGRQRDRSVVTG